MCQVLQMIFTVMMSQALAAPNPPAASGCDSNNTYCPSPDGTSYDLYPGDGQYYQMCGLIEAGVACANVTTIPLPSSELYKRGPYYIWVVNDSPSNRQVDSICTSLFPTGGVSFVAYNYITYCDGSTEIISNIASDIDIGVSTRGDGLTAATLRIFAFLGNNTRVTCEIQNFAESNGRNIVVTSFDTIYRDEIQQIQDIYRSNCLAPEGLYMLPYRHPPQCVTQQLCDQNN